MRSQQQQSVWITGVLLSLMVSPVWAIEKQEFPNQQETARQIEINSSTLSDEIPLRNPIEQPATTIDEWLDQIAQASIIQITEIRLNAVNIGVEVILETANGQLPESSTSVVGNALIIEIPDAVLALPDSDEFQQVNLVEGIALISVTSLPNNRVRVAITGADAPPVAEVRTEAQGLVLSVVPGTETADEAEDAIQVVVTGEQDGYAPNDATTATRTNTPLRDIPQSIQVIPQQVLEDQQVLQLQDATRNVSGVVEGNTFGNTQDRFIIRGFQQGFQLGSLLRNGFREPADFISLRETANIERIEILKGPASALYGGAIEPGGVINVITEQPLDYPFYELEAQAGSFGLLRPNVDLSGPLTSDRSLLYRLNAVYERGDSFRDFDQDIQRVFVSPVVLWRIGDRTDLTLEFEYLNDERPFDRGLIAFEDGVADIPFDRVLGEPDDVATSEEFTVGYRLEHQFNEDWRLRNAFRFGDVYSTNQRTEPGELNEETGILTRAWEDHEYSGNTYAFLTSLVGEFSTGPIEHTLLLGADLERQVYRFEDYFTDGPDINIFDPDYGTESRPDQEDYPGGPGLYDQTVDILGFYVQDQIALLDNLKIQLSGRFDIVNQTIRLGGIYGDSETEQQDEAFTPRVGIVYQPIEPLSLYTSFSQTFAPNSARTVSGSILDPERGTQYEVGIRGEFLDDRLIANLAAYQITKTNVAAADPDNLDFSIPVGEQRSRGVELDIAGEILPGWNVIASYAYTDAEVTRDNSPREGNRLSGVPENAASVWSTYEIQNGDLQGLGFGLGLFFVGERQGDLDNTYQIPSYVRTDAAVFYRRDNWRAAINIKNLFDVGYIESSFNRIAVSPGQPFTVLGTVSVEF